MSRFYLFILFFLLVKSVTLAQRISRPEKWWALTHPFIARRTFIITKQVLLEVDSIKKEKTIGEDLSGGKLDAFKHSYWMASVSNRYGAKKALKLGVAHEKGNYLQYKKGKPEDGLLPDSISSVMDLANNQIGATTVKHKFTSAKEIQHELIGLINSGKLLVIKKSTSGNFLTCDGTVIDLQKWTGRWDVPKCLVPSDLN